jgi:hypothetical protein
MIKVAASCAITATLILLHMARAASCPSECTCKDKETKCLNISLNSVPKNFSNTTNKLTISYNNIQILKNGDFSLPELKFISLNNNGIQRVAPEVFCSTEQLMTLDLSNNKLESVDPVTFCCLKELQFLNLSNNKINFINSSLFQNNANLSVLDLSDNSITTFDPNTFVNNKLLFLLSVKNNSITLSSNWTSESNMAFNVLDIDSCSTCNCSIISYQRIPLLENMRKNVRGISLEELVKKDDLLKIFKSKLRKKEHDDDDNTYLTYNSTLDVVTTSSEILLLCYIKSKSVWLWCSNDRYRNIDTLFEECDQKKNGSQKTGSFERGTLDPKFRNNNEIDKRNIACISLFVATTIIVAIRIAVLVVRLKRTKEKTKVPERVVLEDRC